jgi:hypothetical protein
MKRIILLACLLVLAPLTAFAQRDTPPCSEAEIQQLAAIAAGTAQATKEDVYALQECALALNHTIETEIERLNQDDPVANSNESSEGKITEAAGTRSNPVPLGEYVLTDKGRFRIVNVLSPYAPKSFSNVPNGFYVIALEVEYICENNNVDESCTGFDILVNGTIMPDGTVIDTMDVIVTDDPWFPTMEAFPGNTLTGNLYISAPGDQTPESVRFYVDFDEVYFGLE